MFLPTALTGELDPDQVTPGVIGFIAIFVVAAITILLVLDMSRRVRRTRYRGEVRERLEQERLEQERRDAGEAGPEDRTAGR